MTGESPAEEAAGLHRDDRAAVLGNPERVTGPIATLLALVLHDLASCRRDNSVFLNDRGLAVRTHLISQGADHDR